MAVKSWFQIIFDILKHILLHRRCGEKKGGKPQSVFLMIEDLRTMKSNFELRVLLGAAARAVTYKNKNKSLLILKWTYKFRGSYKEMYRESCDFS